MYRLCAMHIYYIAESRNLSRIAPIRLSPQFPHSRQVFSFALVHVEVERSLRAVVVLYRVSPREVFLAIEFARKTLSLRMSTDMRFLWTVLLCVFIATIVAVHAKPTIYKRNEDNVFEPVMVPVSSTVIPLPVYKVGYGLGFISKDKKAQSSFKPEGGIKLITINKIQEKKI
ncbi:uncharacterized protein LOC105199716 [Solenopsis invicta]|uniref:uncharacterized protein LOC105199716 n=1 Tax=Solenopsis invicta TaxID=13686 RepID=UPI00193D2C6C|nr:uncharacterized protein LOC105199716 [Solenopsis invicta]